MLKPNLQFRPAWDMYGMGAYPGLGACLEHSYQLQSPNFIHTSLLKILDVLTGSIQDQRD